MFEAFRAALEKFKSWAKNITIFLTKIWLSSLWNPNFPATLKPIKLIYL
jgi:hypothetical protein